ncbi:MAG: YbdD/YjiX family protein [Steroidobacteraceae bacterium]
MSAGSIGAAWLAFWRGVRTATGDDAYERYLRHYTEAHSGAKPLSRRAFFEAEQQRKWSRINRCC